MNQIDTIQGDWVTLDNEQFYKISNCDKMRPFFMSIVSDSNHWMFISSNGGLSAGRKNADFALFPYYTDDKITESTDVTGSKTIFQIHKAGKTLIWEPFSIRQFGIYNIKRNLYKNSYGNKVVFEEINTDLGLTFRYQWNSSSQFGFVKKSALINNSKEKINVTVLDGLQNIVPSGINSALQNSYSNLVDAYKRSELQAEVGLGIYALSAVIVDKPEPSEALKSNIIWSVGFNSPTYLVSSLQLNNFRSGQAVTQEVDVKAEKGAYFIVAPTEIEAGSQKDWMFVANVNQSITGVVQISEIIKNEKDIVGLVQNDIDLGTKNLVQLTGA